MTKPVASPSLALVMHVASPPGPPVGAGLTLKTEFSKWESLTVTFPLMFSSMVRDAPLNMLRSNVRLPCEPWPFIYKPYDHCDASY